MKAGDLVVKSPLWRNPTAVNMLSWSKKLEENPAMNFKGIYVQTSPEGTVSGSSRMIPQKQIFNTFQFNSMRSNEPKMFILYSALKMPIDSFSVSSG